MAGTSVMRGILINNVGYGDYNGIIMGPFLFIQYSKMSINNLMNFEPYALDAFRMIWGYASLELTNFTRTNTIKYAHHLSSIVDRTTL